jgi:hypothetical protein
MHSVLNRILLTANRRRRSRKLAFALCDWGYEYFPGRLTNLLIRRTSFADHYRY